MMIVLLQFLGLALVIVAAGIVLTHAADVIAEATGLGRLLIGSILLAGATSLPELSVDLAAIRLGFPDLAIGDLLGSCLINLLILAALDLTRQSRGKMLSRTAAAHALSGLFSISLIALVGLGLLTTKQIPDWSFLRIHIWVWAIGAAYFLGVRMVFLDQRLASQATSSDSIALTPAENASRVPLWKAVSSFAAAAIVILITGPFLAETAGKVAELSGLGKTFIGTTLVAFSTSLPELVTSLAAVRMGAFDLAIGNVFGSNAFNMLLFVPLDLAYSGSLLSVAAPGHLISAFGAIAATGLVVIGQLYHVERRIRLLEPDAVLVMLVIFVSLGLVYSAG